MQTMSPQLAPGTVLGDTYRIVRLIGRGGMGDVYEATHARLAGRYALKVLGPGGMEVEDLVLRFRREAEVTSGLRHPNIVSVVDYNTTPDRRPYLVMEFLEGTELTAEIRRAAPMPIPRVLDLVGQITSALAAAHGRKIVHRDLKPQNLFLVTVPGEEREIVKVMDFGISKVREATTQLTQDTAIMGTPQYMAPEQAQGRLAEIDERSDQFALGAITYELLTGCAAFRGATVPSLLYQVVHENPAPIRAYNPGVPPAVEAVVLRAMAKRKEQRFATVRDFHRDLTRAAGDSRQGPVAAPAPPVLPNWVERPASVTTFGTANGQLHPETAPPARGRGKLLAAAAVAAAVTAGGLLWRPGAGVPVVAPAERPPEPVAPATVPLQLEEAPAGLQVLLDGAPAHPPLELLRGPVRHTLVFSAPGYQPFTVQLDGQEARTQSLRAMQREPAPPVRPSPPPAPPPRPAVRRAPPPRAAKRESAGRAPEPAAPRAAPAVEPKPEPSGKRGRLILDL